MVAEERTEAKVAGEAVSDHAERSRGPPLCVGDEVLINVAGLEC